MAFSLVLSCVLLWSFLSFTTAFDITKILNQYSDYAVFNQELSKTHVAGEINKRKSVTVLVVPNGAMSGVTSLKDDSLSNIMKIHVVLDYYDSAKIKKLKDGTKVTTLYQTTGSAEKEGFLKVQKDNNNNEIKLGSAVSGSQISARVNKVVTSIASDISVIEISSPIVPTGLDDSKTSGKSSSPSSSPSPSSDSSPAKSPSKSKKKHSDAPSPNSSDSDSDSDDSPTPAPAPSHKHKHKHKHKHSHAPAPSDADAPSDEDADADADVADADDADADDADADDREADEDDSTSSRNTVVSGGILLASLFATL